MNKSADYTDYQTTMVHSTVPTSTTLDKFDPIDFSEDSPTEREISPEDTSSVASDDVGDHITKQVEEIERRRQLQLEARLQKQKRMKEANEIEARSFNKVDMDKLRQEKQEQLQREKREHMQSLQERYKRMSLAKPGSLASPTGRRTSNLRVSIRTPPRKNNQRRSDILAAAVSAVTAPPISPRKGKDETKEQHSYETLMKKLKKVEKLQKELLEEKGEEAGKKSKAFKKYESKRLAYLRQIEETEEYKRLQEDTIQEEEEDDDSDNESINVVEEDEESKRQQRKLSMERQARRQSDIDMLQEQYRRLSVQRIDAEKAAEIAEAANLAISDEDDSDLDEYDLDDTIHDENKEEPEKRSSVIAMNILLANLDELQNEVLVQQGDNNASFIALERRRSEYILDPSCLVNTA